MYIHDCKNRGGYLVLLFVLMLIFSGTTLGAANLCYGSTAGWGQCPQCRSDYLTLNVWVRDHGSQCFYDWVKNMSSNWRVDGLMYSDDGYCSISGGELADFRSVPVYPMTIWWTPGDTTHASCTPVGSKKGGVKAKGLQNVPADLR